MWNYVPYVEMPKDFKREISKNFCAMKYYHQQPTHRQLAIVQKARELDEEQMKQYVIQLGNIEI